MDNTEALKLTFDQIEGAFPEGATTEEDGYVRVSAQWLHDFARNIAALSQPPAVQVPEDLMLGEWLQSDGVRFLSPQESRFLLNGDEIEMHPNRLMAIINAARASSPSPAAVRVEEANRIRALEKAGFELTARLCAIGVAVWKDGHELIRRDSVMELVTKWRMERDAAKGGE